LCANIGSCGGNTTLPRFTRAYPLRPALLSAPAFTVQVAELVPGGFVALELAPGAIGSRRLLQLRGAGGGVLPPTARLAILRIE